MEMRKQAREIRYFLFGQQFADGLRITLAILVPAVIAYNLGHFEVGLAFSLGALCVSITDSPGPVHHKRNAMMYCTLILFILSIITGLLKDNMVLMGLEVLIASFIFSMLSIYGPRAGSVGTGVLLMIFLSMDVPGEGGDVIKRSALIAGGAVWYMSITLLASFIQPFRTAQRALGDCIREIAKYLSIKGDFYNIDTDLGKNYSELVAQQIEVNEKLESVREILFKTRQIVKESTAMGRNLVYSFVDVVDLLEEITASYYDYQSIRNKYAGSGVLKSVSDLIKKMADELDRIGIAVQSNSRYIKRHDFEAELRMLKREIDEVAEHYKGSSNLVLKRIVVNLRRLLAGFKDITLSADQKVKERYKRNRLEYNRFVTPQSFEPRLLISNFTMESEIFRHALRVSIACFIGYLIAKFIGYGHHSYWILLTVAFILKPAFGLTKQRNYHRIIGTVVGGLIGLLVLYTIDNTNVLFAFLVLFMIGAYSFQRINYLVMVVCITPYVLILFKFLNIGFLSAAEERVIDTVIGCSIAFAASFLFPKWESEQLRIHLANMLNANIQFLEKILKRLAGNEINVVDYKLARKELYIKSAGLSAAFQRMLSEPKNKQKHGSEIHQFVVLNQILLFNMASLSSVIFDKDTYKASADGLRFIKRAISFLGDGVRKLDENAALKTTDAVAIADISGESSISSDEILLNEQLQFISKVSGDINKAINTIVSSEKRS
jgi:uncharacterized membrane protein (TIGR01666 family)